MLEKSASPILARIFKRFQDLKGFRKARGSAAAGLSVSVLNVGNNDACRLGNCVLIEAGRWRCMECCTFSLTRSAQQKSMKSIA
jgi:hypothetical protein